ncbi:MAG: translocation/assembly module TamB domain-containing protein [Burkholderiales bacterium]|nr:translocation/assembly module TamB domain-containing protein [Burkholderiales bacterium]
MTDPRRRRYRARALLVLAALAAALAGAAVWLASTETALAWIVDRLVAASGGRLDAAGVRGKLVGPITAERIAYTDPSFRVEIRALRIDWSPAHLLRGRVALDRLEARHVSVWVAASSGPMALPDDLGLPFGVRIRHARIDAIDVELNADRATLRDVQLGYDGDARTHRFHELEMELETGAGHLRVRANAELRARQPFAVAAAVELAQAPSRSASVRLAGTLARVELDATAAVDSVSLACTAALRPFEPRWLEALEARAQDVDLARLAGGAPQTAVTLRVEARSETDSRLVGHLVATNRMAGPIDRGLAPVGEVTAEFSTDLRTARLAPLRIALTGGGWLVGTGDVAGDKTQLVLGARALNLRAMHTALIETALAGRLEATLAPGRQALRASLAQAPITLAADIQRVGEEVQFREVRAAAKRGELHASGTLRLTGGMPLAAQARFARFDPSEWGDYPPATLNGEFAAQVELARRAGTVRFALSDSRLRGVPLSAHGVIEGIEDGGRRRIAATRVEAVLGANRASVDGAFGTAADELRISLAAPRFAEIDPRTRGRVDAQARVTGTWDAPHLVFSASAVDLRHGTGIALGTLGATGELGWAPDAPTRIDATAGNVALGGLSVERAAIHVSGTPAQHAIDVQATGARHDLVARLDGGWRPGRGWAGSIATLALRGPDSAELEQATPVEIGPDFVRVGAFTARVADGRVAAGETRWAPGNLTSSGEFTRLPVSPLLAALGAGDAVTASLTVSGSWQLAATPRWNGRVHVARDSGDLVFRTEPALPLGLSALRLDAHLVDERASGVLVARGTGIELTAEAEAMPVDGNRDAGLGRDSPLALKARLDIPSLKPFAALFGIPASVGGRVHADVAAAGTLGSPAWRGTLEAYDVRVQSPPYGIDWEGGRLSAELAESTVRITDLAITAGGGRFAAQGVLERAGETHTGRLAWSADRFAALNRPDRNLTLSGSGTLATDARRLTLRGALRADAGHFELDPRRTAVLGEDVVVLGRSHARAVRQAGERRLPVVLDLDLDLGDALTVRGAGLDARLAGRLKVQSLPTGQLIAKGTIDTSRGVFHAYGQKLEIERGRLLFDGPLDNPGLDIAAWRRNQAVEAGVEVKGPLRTPLVRVVSNPPVPESEQIAWLVLGRPAETGAQADYAALQVAAAALLDSTGGGPERSVAQMVGLDEIGFRSTGTTGERAVALGKRLGDRLYATYEQSIDAALAVLRLEFSLTRRISVRAETGRRSGMDLFYRFSFD